jgi:hypothetical protein
MASLRWSGLRYIQRRYRVVHYDASQVQVQNVNEIVYVSSCNEHIPRILCLDRNDSDLERVGGGEADGSDTVRARARVGWDGDGMRLGTGGFVDPAARGASMRQGLSD